MIELKPLPPCLSQKQRTNLWSKVDCCAETYKCWPWTGRLGPSGYPRVWVNHIPYCATRIAYLDFYGKQPGDLLVCHTCDNPSCMNPHHFFLGNSKANMEDKANKGRAVRGSRHHTAKLSEEDVMEILALEGRETSVEIAKRYGVSKSTIKAIFQGVNWSHLTGRLNK